MFYAALLADCEPGDEDRLSMRHRLPVTPGTCRMLPVDDERTAFTLWPTFGELPERTVLFTAADDDAGRRTEALNAFFTRSATGLRRRKMEFMARMRR